MEMDRNRVGGRGGRMGGERWRWIGTGWEGGEGVWEKVRREGGGEQGRESNEQTSRGDTLEAYCEISDVDGEGSRKEEDLSITRHEGYQLVEGVLVVHGEELVCLVQYQHVTLTGVGYTLLQEIQQSARCSHNDMDCEREGGKRGERGRGKERGEGRENL